jgi:chromosome segregation ATPase
MESTVSTMKSRVRSVMMDRDLAQSHLSASESTVQKHLDQITSLTKTISSLKDTLANSKSLISNLEAKLTTMIPKEDHNNIVEDLTNRIEDLLSDGLEASHIRSRLESDLKSAADQNHTLTHKLDSCNQSLSRLRDEISSLQSESESKQRKIDSFEAEFNRLRKSSEQDQQSLESSHAIALALAEQSAAGALSRASVASSALELTQRRLNELVSENERLRNDAVMSNIKPLVSSVSSQTTFERKSVSIQIEAPSTEVQQVQTDTVQFVTKEIQDLCLCSKCNTSIHDFSLFPCGHGLCVECCESLIVADEISLGGISCDQCEDKLPVTRIIRNRSLERLANLLTCSNK